MPVYPQAAKQSELLCDFRGLIQQKQEAAHSMLQLLTEYFLGERLAPVGPMDSQYATYVSSLANHH